MLNFSNAAMQYVEIFFDFSSFRRDWYSLQSACVTDQCSVEDQRCHCALRRLSAMCVKNEREETFAPLSANFTGPLVSAKKHAVRLPWTLTTVFT